MNWDSVDSHFNAVKKRMMTLEQALLNPDRALRMLTDGPNVEVANYDNKLEITAELPGLKKSDVQVEIDERDRLVCFSGEQLKKSESGSVADGNYYSERFYGKFKRCFDVPENAKLTAVRATMDDGLLKLEIPKDATYTLPEKKKTIRID